MSCESRAMRLQEIDLAEAATILIAVGDGVLADSLRFSLELEGFDVKLCDEHCLLRAIAGTEAPSRLVLDQDVFARMLNGKAERRLAELGFPVILMVGHKTEKVVARAAQFGVTQIVEKPLLGAVLLDAIRTALRETTPLRRARRAG
jgi:DNA-binding NtrC family response regulator